MKNENNGFYNRNLKPLAKTLRQDSTKAEIRIWCELLNKNKLGYSILRQRPISNYIVDFMCKELKLIIEVDGYSHRFKMEEDIERDRLFSDLGYTVLRFTDDEVMKDLPNVQRTIESWIAERQQ